jgi:hypothetical protein
MTPFKGGVNGGIEGEGRGEAGSPPACPACGNVNESDIRFCEACGTPLVSTGVPPPETNAETPPGEDGRAVVARKEADEAEQRVETGKVNQRELERLLEKAENRATESKRKADEAEKAAGKAQASLKDQTATRDLLQLRVKELEEDLPVLRGKVKEAEKAQEDLEEMKRQLAEVKKTNESLSGDADRAKIRAAAIEEEAKRLRERRREEQTDEVKETLDEVKLIDGLRQRHVSWEKLAAELGLKPNTPEYHAAAAAATRLYDSVAEDQEEKVKRKQDQVVRESEAKIREIQAKLDAQVTLIAAEGRQEQKIEAREDNQDRKDRLLRESEERKERLQREERKLERELMEAKTKLDHDREERRLQFERERDEQRQERLERMERERRDFQERLERERADREEHRKLDDRRREEERQAREETWRSQERRREEERIAREQTHQKALLEAAAERERLIRDELIGTRKKIDEDERVRREQEKEQRYLAAVARQEELVADMRQELEVVKNGGTADGTGDLFARLTKAKKEAEQIQALFGDGEKMTPGEIRKYDMMEKGLTSLTNLGVQVMGAMQQGSKGTGARAGAAAGARGARPGRSATAGPPPGWKADESAVNIDNERFRWAAPQFFDMEVKDEVIRHPYKCTDGTIIIPPVYVAEAAPELRAAGVTFVEHRGHLILHPRDQDKAKPVIDALPER